MDSHETTNPLMIEFVSLSSDVLLRVNMIRCASYDWLNVTIGDGNESKLVYVVNIIFLTTKFPCLLEIEITLRFKKYTESVLYS